MESCSCLILPHKMHNLLTWNTPDWIHVLSDLLASIILISKGLNAKLHSACETPKKQWNVSTSLTKLLNSNLHSILNKHVGIWTVADSVLWSLYMWNTKAPKNFGREGEAGLSSVTYFHVLRSVVLLHDPTSSVYQAITTKLSVMASL